MYVDIIISIIHFNENGYKMGNIICNMYISSHIHTYIIIGTTYLMRTGLNITIFDCSLHLTDLVSIPFLGSAKVQP